MPFPFLTKRGSSKDEEDVDKDPNWSADDDKALKELKRALREYYNGENLSQRSTKLASLKMFGSWDNEDDEDDDEDPRNWEDADVKAWRQFCADTACFDDEQNQHIRNKSIMYEQAEDEVAMTKANPADTNIWPVAIVQNTVTMEEGTKKKKYSKKSTHCDVVFVSQDKYRCAHGIEVLATPKNKLGDVYATQSLAKF